MRRDARTCSSEDIERRAAFALIRSVFVVVDGSCIEIRPPLGEESAPRLCRYEPSLSNQSNRWGQPWQQQAFRSLVERDSGPAQMLPTVRDPEVMI